MYTWNPLDYVLQEDEAGPTVHTDYVGVLTTLDEPAVVKESVGLLAMLGADPGGLLIALPVDLRSALGRGKNSFYSLSYDERWEKTAEELHLVLEKTRPPSEAKGRERVGTPLPRVVRPAKAMSLTGWTSIPPSIVRTYVYLRRVCLPFLHPSPEECGSKRFYGMPMPIWHRSLHRANGGSGATFPPMPRYLGIG